MLDGGAHADASLSTASQHLDEAIRALSQGDDLESVRVAEERMLAAVAADPEDRVGAMGHLAWLYFKTERYARAAEVYRAHLRLHPGDAEAWYLLGTSLYRIQQGDEAFGAYVRVLRRPYCLRRAIPAGFHAVVLGARRLGLGRLHRAVALTISLPLIAWADRIRGESRFGTAAFIRWAKRHWAMSLYHLSYSRAAEYAFAFRVLEPDGESAILDIGTGVSAFMAFAADTGLRIVGTDYDACIADMPVHCPSLREEPLRSRLKLARADGMRLPFVDGSFKRVMSISTIEHIPGDGDLAMIREIARVLAPGGRAVVTSEGGNEHFWHWSRMRFHVGFQYQEASEQVALPGQDEGSVGFYRFYDEANLRSRLGTAPGLRCVEYGFLVDRFQIRRFFPDVQMTLLEKLIVPWRALLGRLAYRQTVSPIGERRANLVGSVAYVILEKTA